MLATIVKFTPAHAKLRLANLPSLQHLQRVDTAARSLLNVDRIPRYFIRHKLLYSTICSSSHATSSSVSAPRPQQLVPSSILDRSKTTYFAPQDRITRTAALEGTTKNTTQGVPPFSGGSPSCGSPAAAGTKRRASSDLLSLKNRIPKARIEPINYGTSVFFARAKSTLAPTSASQGTTPPASQEGTPDSSHEPEPRSMVIRLTEQEDKICSVLDEVAKRYEEKQGKKVQLRIAGGWVRDKVMITGC